MKLKHDTLNEIIKENKYKSYLEIGYGNGYNFNKIECKDKIAVDPNTLDDVVMQVTSDDFFNNKEVKYDLIHVDGDHNHDQVEKDIINAYECLSRGGMIVLHDVNPHNKKMQECPRNTKQWTGDVWRCFVGFRENYPKIKTDYLDETYGLGVIKKTGTFKVKEGFTNLEMTYEDFAEDKDFYLKG